MSRMKSRQRLTFPALYVSRHSVQSQLIQDFVRWAEAQGAGEEVTQEVHWQEHRGAPDDDKRFKNKQNNMHAD